MVIKKVKVNNMNDRLTKKVGENYCSQNGDFYDVYNKLGELEDLADEISCPLDVYVKIQLGLVDTIYVKRYETVREYWDENGIQLEQKESLQPRLIIRVDRRDFCYQDLLGKECMSFSEYGTEFWLREDKSK